MLSDSNPQYTAVDIIRNRRVALAAVSLALFAVACASLQRMVGIEGDRGLRFDHALHTEQGLDCTDCHGMEDEEGEVLPMPLVPDHENCNLCHDIIGDAEDISSCNLCHTRSDQLVDDREWILSPEQIFAHQPHAEAEIDCTTCHEAPDAGRLPDVPIMEWCMDCHGEYETGPTMAAAEQATVGLNDCATCHHDYRLEVAPEFRGETRIAHNVEELWEHVHGRESRVDAQFCAKCHGDHNFCEECHTQEAPDDHTLAFRRRTHGLHASWERQKCSVCHEEQSCLQCHENNEPRSHRAGWGAPLNTHCVSCHFPSEQTNCTVCHQSIEHRTALISPHSFGIFPSNCSACHPGGVPTRAPHLHNSSIDCVVCHN